VGECVVSIFVFGYWGASPVDTLEVWGEVEGNGETAVVKRSEIWVSDIKRGRWL